MQQEQSTPGKHNKGVSSTFQPPNEIRGVRRPKHCDKHGDKEEDSSPINLITLICTIHADVFKDFLVLDYI